MEPFQLSLNQVNFDEEAFGESDELDSFSNVVSYDSDFKQDNSEGLPVRSRRIEQYEVADSFHCSQVNHLAKVMDESKFGIGPLHIVPSAKDAKVEEDHKEHDNESPVGTTHKKDNLKISDSFKAFTETVEALALQKSVIGKRNVVPASADEVARVVAATRARLNVPHDQKSADSVGEHTRSDVESPGSQDSNSTSRSGSKLSEEPASASLSSDAKSSAERNRTHSEGKVENAMHGVGRTHVVDTSNVARSDAHDGKIHDERQVEPENVSGKNVSDRKTALAESNTVSANRSAVESLSSAGQQGTSQTANSSSKMIEGKELIRISPKEISTATKKSQSSWFWSKSSSDVTPSTQGPSRKVQATKSPDPEGNSMEKNQQKKSKKEKTPSGDAEQNRPQDLSMQIQNPECFSEKSSDTLKTTSSEMASTSRSLSKDGSKNEAAIRLENTTNISSSSIRQSFNTTSTTQTSAFEVHSSNRWNEASSLSSTSTLSEQRSSSDNIYALESPSNASDVSFEIRTPGNGKLADDNVDEITSINKTSVSVENSYNIKKTNMTVYVSEERNHEVISRQDSADISFSGSKDELQLRMEQILKEKVKLEGQVEVLEAESSQLLKERAELQTKVAALMQELQSREKSRAGLAGDRDALSADLETLRQNRARLEAVIIDAHKLLEDKDQELQTLENDLEQAKNATDKQLDQVKNFQMEVKSRDATITDLKNKITELYVEFQTTNQNRILAENEVGSLQGELKSMAAAKEWYKEQLQFFQREKAELQAEVTRVKTEMIAQGTAIERLKAENQRTKRQLTESDQKSLNEKQALARHLESIEADMMEREAAFAQLQKDRQTASDTKDERAEGEMVSTLQEDLNKMMLELKRSNGQVALLQQEQTELVKRLTLSQESILDRDKTIEGLEKNAVDLESQLKQFHLELSTHKEEIGRLEHDRTILQMELKSAKEEKEVFDSSLRSLKDDMSTVEKSFRLMKQELLMKQSELDRLKAEAGKMYSQSTDVPGPVSKELREIQQSFDYSPVHSIVRSLTKYQSSETQTDGEPVASTNEEEKITETKMLELESSVRNQFQEEKKSFEKQLVEFKQMLETAESEKQHLSKSFLSSEQELVILKERTVDLELRLEKSCQEKEILLRGDETEKDKIDGKVQAALENTEEILKLQMENTDLKSKLGDLQRESHKEIAKQKTKVLKLGKQLEMALKEHREKCRMNDEQIEELKLNLTTLQESNTRLEEELKNTQQRATLDQDARTSQLQEELQKRTEELEGVRIARHTLEVELNQLTVRYQTEIEEYKIRIVHAETELQSTRNYIEERRVADAETANLALELEREKGRLAGFLRSHSTLKEHAVSLEASLASKESSVVQLSSEVEDDLKNKDRHIQELTEQVHLLEESVAREQQNVKDVRKQLMTEKGNHIKVRRELEHLTTTHSQSVLELELLHKELSKKTEDEEKTKSDDLMQKVKLEQLQAEIKAVKLERDRMSRELEDREARDSAIQEQMQSLEWKLSQKVAEIEAAGETARLIDERRQSELSAINQSLQASSSELYLVRDELAVIKHEKAELKAKVTQLKQVLTSIVEQCTKATEAGKAITIQMILNKEEIEQLLEESSTPSIQSKPLSFLQATLNGLRGEISSLQKQVNEHTSVVQTSSQAWKQLEAQVEDLRQVCKSSAAHRAASDKLLKTTEELSHLPPLADIQLALQLPSTGPLVLPGNMVSIVKTTSHSSTSSRTETVEIVENKTT